MTHTSEQTRQSIASRGRAALGDRVFWILCLGAGLLVLAILALILVTTVREAWPALSSSGFEFVTSSEWVPNDADGPGPGGPTFGALAFIYGTVIVSLIALTIAVPISVGIALFLTELSPRRLRGSPTRNIDAVDE